MGSVEAIVDRGIAAVDDGAALLIACAVVAASADARDGLSAGSADLGTAGERWMLCSRAEPTLSTGPNDVPAADARPLSASPERACRRRRNDSAAAGPAPVRTSVPNDAAAELEVRRVDDALDETLRVFAE